MNSPRLSFRSGDNSARLSPRAVGLHGARLTESLAPRCTAGALAIIVWNHQAHSTDEAREVQGGYITCSRPRQGGSLFPRRHLCTSSLVSPNTAVRSALLSPFYGCRPESVTNYGKLPPTAQIQSVARVPTQSFMGTQPRPPVYILFTVCVTMTGPTGPAKPTTRPTWLLRGKVDPPLAESNGQVVAGRFTSAPRPARQGEWELGHQANPECHLGSTTPAA